MAVNPDVLEAQRLVHQLQGQGMSLSEIGRRVGRSGRYIGFAAKGQKGANLVPALKQLAGGATSVNVARRTTKSGLAAKVRGGIKTIPGTSNISVKTKRGNKTLVGGINSIKGQGKHLKWRITVSWVKTISDKKYKNTGIDGHLPRGWTSDDLANRIANPAPGDNWQPGDARAALKEIALSQNQGAYTSAGAVLDVHLYSTD